jgi:Secretion system C-terminal sorting domain/FG-GAP-like repeat/ASPIC and UnbV/SprB repeat
MKKLFALLLALTSLNAFTQFTEVGTQQGIVLTGNTIQSGCGASMYDFNHDGWDDLTLGQPFNAILAYTNNNGNYEIAAVFDNNGDPKAIQWVDYDNDGDSDFFFSVLNQSCKLYRNDGNLQFTNVTANLDLPITNGKSFGCSWGDYDNDSFLDLYICNYSTGPTGHTNWLLHNNGDGTFTNVTAAMGVGNETRPSYQSSWVDFNLDGLLDLYVVNDFDWMNELYLNNGTTFDAVGATYNLNVAMEGMSNSWSDFDADGDFDVFISNNTQGNVLLRNDNSLMTDIGSSAGVLVNSTCWGSLWIDYDHDGLDDLHVATSAINVNGNQNYLFHNNGDYTFSDESLTGDNLIVFASAKGDKNNDGWWDFLEMRQYPAAIAIWQNDGGSNHWIKVGLTGTASNKEGVGSIIKYYYPGKSGMLQTHIGEGYLDQDSQYEIISMAENTTLDSLIIEWPSGWIDRHYNLNADQFFAFVEGETYQAEITSNAGNQICPADGNLMLMASDGSSFLWSNDSTSQSITVSMPGIYSVEVTNEFGISSVADFEVMEFELPVISADYTEPSCFGLADGCIVLTPSIGAITQVDWNGLVGEATRCDLVSGIYETKVYDDNGCVQNITYELLQPNPLTLELLTTAACFGSTGTVDALPDGGVPAYTFDWNGIDPNAVPPGEFSVTVFDINNCEYEASYVVDEYEEVLFLLTPDTVCQDQTIELNYEVVGGIDPYMFNWNGEDPNALAAGDYEFSMYDGNACQVFSSVQIMESTNMELTAEIQNAQNGNNGSAVVSVSGGIEPYNFVWNDSTIGNTLSNAPQGTYEVQVTDAAGCLANLEIAIIDINVDEFYINVFVAPNPASDRLSIQSNSQHPISIYDAYGKIVYSNASNALQTTINVEDWPNGVYFLKLGNVHKRIVVQHN